MQLPSIFRSREVQSVDAGQGLQAVQVQTKPTRSHEARSELFCKIEEFLVRHDLPVTAQNLATICGALSGSNLELAEVFALREISGEPVDQRWLDTLVRLDPDGHNRLVEVEVLMDKLEYALMRFAQTARLAQSEAQDHRGALGAKIVEMSDLSLDSRAASDLAEVLDLSRAMFECIERVESAMSKSQCETEQLRESLAKARMEADVDHLTRLPNRRAFERRLLSAAMEARAKGEPLSLAFCDVDHFKMINDRHGHDAGDRVLCALAATLGEHGGDSCFVARHGGEEFVILLYGLDKQAALAKVETMRRAQSARRMVNRDTEQGFGRITFSAGIAEVTEDPDTRSALKRADAALYRAKSEGRNRVVIG